jgi:O-antigen ligase
LLLVGVAASFSIAMANIVLGLAFVVWVAALAAGSGRLRRQWILVPIAAWAVWLTVSALASPDPAASVAKLGNLPTLLIVPMALALLNRARWRRFVILLAATSAVSSAVAVVQTLSTGIDLQSRAPGLFSHYMTFAGWTMAAVLVLVGQFLFAPRRSDRRWLAPVIVLHGLVLTLSLTRNAWLGLAAGLGLAAVVWRPRSLLAVPLLAVIAVAVLPGTVRERITSVADLQQHANRDRLEMARAGLAIIADHPVFGVGPEGVEAAYPQYRSDAAVRKNPSHLHSNPIQIAAEYGLPALFVWLATLGVFGWGVWRGIENRRPPPAPLVSTALAVTGLTVAGLFEYNWGDAEIWILTLFLLAVPGAFAEEAA